MPLEEEISGVVLATGSYDHTIRVWHPSTGICLHTAHHSESQVNALQVTNDGSMLAAAGYQMISMYDLNSRGQGPVTKYDQISKNVTAVGFSESSDLIEMPGEQCISSVSFLDRWMFSGGEDCSARVWDLRVGPERKIQCQRIFQVSSCVNSVCLHPNQTELFVGDASGTIHLWDLRTDHNEQLLPEPNASIQHLDVDSEGTMLSAVNNKGVAYVWSLVGPIPSAANSSISGAAANQLSACGSTRLVPKIKVQVHSRYALKCRFSPDSTLLATTSADQTTRLWRTADFSETAVLKAKDGKWVWDCAFTADSQHIFSCSSDGILRLWNTQGGDPVRQYAGHQKAITALAFRDASLPPQY